MTSSSSEDESREDLKLACRDRDADKVSRIFASQQLNADDATAALKDARMDFEVIRVLLQNGADPNSFSIRQAASSERAGELLRLLHEYGYNFKTDGHIVLEDFARDREMLDWLLDRGANINLTDYRRLHCGFNLYVGGRDDSLHLLNKVAADGDIELFDHLVGRGANPLKSIALHSASECQDPDKSRAMICHLLDKHNMDINSNNDDFRDLFNHLEDTGSPLGNAILHRNLAVVHELLGRGATIDSTSMTYPLSFAVEEGGFLPALEPLLRAGADPTEALECAVCHKNLAAVQLCLDFGAYPASALREAVAQEEKRKEEIASEAAYREARPEIFDKKSKLEFKREKLAERNSARMIRMLQYAMDSYTVQRGAGRQ